MRKYLIISLIILVLFTASAPSCGDDQANAISEEAILSASKNDIRAEFETDYLTESNLFAYETTAKQKLSDLSDYFLIMTDTSLDMPFRVKAGEMIKRSFQSENVTIQCIEQGQEPLKELNVQLLVREGLENKLQPQHFTFDSICIDEPLHRTDEKTYTGILMFSQNFTDPANPEKITKSVRRTAGFWVVKQEKVFGTDSLRIWNVQLGDIR